jgi:hypothetical protein
VSPGFGGPLGGGGGGGGGGLAPPPAAGEFYNSASFINLRNGSLSHEQQLELMDVLETEGMHDIDSFLNLGVGVGMAGGQAGHGAVHWG